MGVPVSSLKLMSLPSAPRSPLSGTFVTALSGSVFRSFSFATLIIIYTMVILGGSGSQPGVVLVRY
jgi:ABC-type branched-subunit amino acid transport system permease subunit